MAFIDTRVSIFDFSIIINNLLVLRDIFSANCRDINERPKRFVAFKVSSFVIESKCNNET